MTQSAAPHGGMLHRGAHHPATGTLTPSLFIAVATIASWAYFFLFGHIRDFFRNMLPSTRRKLPPNVAPIRQDYEDFYTRRMFYRIHDCWNRPLASAPDAYVDVLDRTPVRGQAPLTLTGTSTRALNLGSYNYLGFAAHDEYCTPRVLDTLAADGVAACAARPDGGTCPTVRALERELADFLGVDDAVVFGMGFATNSAVLPALAGRGCLLVSDALNHASIVAGARGSGARVAVFAHNDMESLEVVLRASIARGQPRTGRPWKKIIIVVEGIYSMEGELVPLPDVVALARRYKCYVYLDEAHSIGALGATGRGVCEEWGVAPRDVDVLMGTFTKSFGGAGGYIAGSAALVDHLKHASPAHLQATALAPAVAQQVLSALRVIAGRDGSARGAAKLAALRDNANYMRARLVDMGVNVLGDWNSPVMPIMLFQPGKIAAMSRECLARGLAMVVVGFPATPLLTARARVCVSAAHTRADLDYALDVIDEVAGLCLLRYGKRRRRAAVARLAGTVAAANGDGDACAPAAASALVT